MLVVSPLYASVLPAGYWPVLSQCGSPGGYKAKEETLKLKCYKALYLYSFKTHNFMFHCKGQLSARSVDYTATDTTHSTPVSPGCWKSYGMCLSGDSCCLVIKTGVTGFGSQQESHCWAIVAGTDPYSPTVPIDQETWINAQLKHPEKCIGASFIIFHGSINLLKLLCKVIG